MDSARESRLGLRGFRQAGCGSVAGRDDQLEIREDSRRSRRLQPLDPQRKVMAGHQSPFHRARG